MNKLMHKSEQIPASVSRSKASLSTLPSEVQSIQTANSPLLLNNKSTGLLLSVLESLMDGILILTAQGKLVSANTRALHICRQLMQGIQNTATTEVPQQIWHICEALIDSCTQFPGHCVTIEDEITVGEANQIRIRARWVELGEGNRPHLLVVLEDRSQSLKDLATVEAYKYGLTEREAQVWLLRRADRTYKAIAAELFITIDTVKKHVRSIHAKRDAFLWANE